MVTTYVGKLKTVMFNKLYSIPEIFILGITAIVSLLLSNS